MLLAKIIFRYILGWKIEGNFSTKVKKTVVIVAPHTSWHDFYIGALARKLLKVPINFIAKKELFDSAFGWYFKWMGGEPIDRSSSQNTVDQIVGIFNSKPEFRLAIAPEGTRKKVKSWKTGFYYIAKKANVPITSVAFDYKTKTVSISKPFYVTGEYQKDLRHIQSFFSDAVGKVPEYS